MIGKFISFYNANIFYVYSLAFKVTYLHAAMLVTCSDTADQLLQNDHTLISFELEKKRPLSYNDFRYSLGVL